MQNVGFFEVKDNKYVHLFQHYRKCLTKHYYEGVRMQDVQSFTHFYDDDIISKLNNDYRAVGEDLGRAIAKYGRSITKLTK